MRDMNDNNFRLNAVQQLNISREEAWEFFSSPRNLARITPPSMDFRIISELNGDKIVEGMCIEYSVRPILGIPVRWKSKITRIKPGVSFTDLQLKGPYKYWEHKHTFSEENGGITMRDEIRYKLFGGWFGKILHRLYIRGKLNELFEYRERQINKIFANGS